MNCYYSNLIEGHNTTPREIERALQDGLDTAEERRYRIFGSSARVDRLYVLAAARIRA